MIILFIIYIISVIGMWYWIHLAHSKGGKYYIIEKTTIFDVIVVFVPILNTIFMCIAWVVDYPFEKSETKKEINYNKFFKIK